MAGKHFLKPLVVLGTPRSSGIGKFLAQLRHAADIGWSRASLRHFFLCANCSQKVCLHRCAFLWRKPRKSLLRKVGTFAKFRVFCNDFGVEHEGSLAHSLEKEAAERAYARDGDVPLPVLEGVSEVDDGGIERHPLAFMYRDCPCEPKRHLCELRQYLIPILQRPFRWLRDDRVAVASANDGCAVLVESFYYAERAVDVSHFKIIAGEHDRCAHFQ